MTDTQKGLVALILAQTLWGLSPLYYKAVADVPAFEVLAHRTLWTCVLFGGYLAYQGRLHDLLTLMRGPKLRYVIPASLLISVNWGLFIYAIQSGQALEASFGYYVFPLVATLIGMLAFRERLRGLQVPAILLAALAVLVLGIGLGALPWLALSLAITFASYGAIKKSLDAGPILSVTGEVVLLVPIALAYLIGAELFGWGGSVAQPAGAFGHSLSGSLLLIAAGLATGVPLIFFATAARRLPMTVVGMGQYWNSTIQFGLAVLIFGEPFTHWHAIAMPLIWSALALYSVQAIRAESAARKLRRAG
ncbi:MULTISPECIES: EamA family transporter RarD [Roseobacteraceae]|uniref:Protein RarD n=1 Tax=Celeribacter baekdonensis B30 TaxID=1208323 RepID=K2JCR4_9RHOB|nr:MULTISPECIES: EamA family transporter RarD [Roseobacteraceae]EKE72542.1 protein RarD [Celeribacter baekdonensis B30]KAB6714818.1 EamA family transporter RarD [Roseobacter sp. TSBP12]|tara:strand:+ start:25725 stop:26642 length:918 start_codon:yes stop_codon:yes gene_type:complete